MSIFPGSTPTRIVRPGYRSALSPWRATKGGSEGWRVRKDDGRFWAHVVNRLLQSQKLESVGQLTGGIAHDFNNLLTAILGSLDILKRRLPADPKFLKPLENAMAGALRGAGLTQRLLAFARKQDLEIVAVDVVEKVRGMASLLQSSVGSHIVTETRFPLRLDPVRIRPA